MNKRENILFTHIVGKKNTLNIFLTIDILIKKKIKIFFFIILIIRHYKKMSITEGNYKQKEYLLYIIENNNKSIIVKKQNNIFLIGNNIFNTNENQINSFKLNKESIILEYYDDIGSCKFVIKCRDPTKVLQNILDTRYISNNCQNNIIKSNFIFCRRNKNIITIKNDFIIDLGKDIIHSILGRGNSILILLCDNSNYHLRNTIFQCTIIECDKIINELFEILSN